MTTDEAKWQHMVAVERELMEIRVLLTTIAEYLKPKPQVTFSSTEKCERCDGTGAIDAPFSGSDPCCPDCDGTGEISQ